MGRVFKIHNIFLHGFVGFLSSIRGMIKWITPLERVFTKGNTVDFETSVDSEASVAAQDSIPFNIFNKFISLFFIGTNSV